MARLTNKPENGDGYSLICSDTCQNGYNCSVCEHDSEALDKLGAYEDAEDQGLLVRLPCKVGDTVYSQRKNGILEQTVDYISIEEGEIYINVSFCCDNDCTGCPHNNWQMTNEGEYYCDGEYGSGCFAVNDFGKTVFLTRVEAEAVLAKEG